MIFFGRWSEKKIEFVEIRVEPARVEAFLRELPDRGKDSLFAAPASEPVYIVLYDPQGTLDLVLESPCVGHVHEHTKVCGLDGVF